MPTPLPYSPPNSLATIQQKVRRLTRSPSENQLTTTDLNNYINTFVVYDFPEHLRTFNLRQPFSFICNAFQDTYPTDTLSFGTATSNQLYNFQNFYLTVHDPVYIAGFQAFFSQDRTSFFTVYPKIESIQSIGPTGDGITTTFSGVVTSSVSQISQPNNLAQKVTLLQNNVLFSSVDSNNNGVALVDVPVLNTITGNPLTIGNLYVPGFQPATPPTIVDPANNINYVTGRFTITFATAPGAGQIINSQTVPQVCTLPQGLLWYGNVFTLRPVPDQPYQINFEVFKRPTALLASNQSPELEEYWQYIAYGAAKKILEDRLDMDSVQLIMPEFKKQESLVLRRSLVQWANQRTATIYTEQTSYNSGGYWGWGGGGQAF